MWVFKTSSSKDRSCLSVTCLRYKTIVLLLLSITGTGLVVLRPDMVTSSNVQSTKWKITFRFRFSHQENTKSGKKLIACELGSLGYCAVWIFELPYKTSSSSCNWMKIFTLTSNFSQKVPGKSAIANDLWKFPREVGILLCFSSRLRENPNLHYRQPRTQKNLYYTVTDAIVLSIFLRELPYQHQFNGFDWLMMTIYMTKLVHS